MKLAGLKQAKEVGVVFYTAWENSGIHCQMLPVS